MASYADELRRRVGAGDSLNDLFPGSAPNARRKRWAFEPYQPPPIPAGYYDPNLDAQRRAAARGLEDTFGDVELADTRATEDYGFDRADIERERGYAQVDYGRNVQMLTRQYGILGGQQREQAAKYGVTSGGIALLSAAKRRENMALDRSDLDLRRDRAMTGFDQALGRLDVGYGRGVHDRGTHLSRADREDREFGYDVDAQKAYQAQQAGYVAPGGPRNEFVKPDGTPYKVIIRNGWRLEVDQNGRILNSRRRRP